MIERDPKDRQYCRTIPCENCPFARNIKPGETGGSDSAVYIGQCYGPFLISCHMDPEYNPGPERRGQFDIMQCAGATIFRANLGIDYLPETLHSLPVNTELVFGSAAEFLAHHKEITIQEAKEFLIERTPAKLLSIELRKLRSDQIHLIRKKT